MDPVQILLLGTGGATGLIGIVKSIRGPKPGTAMEVRTHQDEIALCAVCGSEAEEYDDARKRWVCGLHIPGVVRSVRQVPSTHGAVQQKQLPAKRKQRDRVDIHDAETIRDERMLRQVSARYSRQDAEYDEYEDLEDELCPHGRYSDEPCRSCDVAVQVQSVQRRPVRTLQPEQQRQPQPRRPQPRQAQPQPQPQPQLQPELLEYAYETVDQYPDVNDAELARVLGLRRADDAYPYRVKALELLGLISVAPAHKPSRRR